MPNEIRSISRKKRLAFYFIVFLIPISTILILYTAYTAYRTRPIYWYVKSRQRGWRGKLHRTDAELGFAPVADAQGAQVFPIGDDVPARYDKDGFRVPLEDTGGASVDRHPIVLALGCSFTYGDATKAEDTYPYLLGKRLGGTAKNAGVGSYGLSQMLVLAKRLVPTHKPDYLVVQYSPWLVDRARSPFAPVYFGTVPTPYFFISQNDLTLHAPVFTSRLFDLPFDRYRNTQAGIVDEGSFLWDVGLPLYIHDDFNLAFFKLRGFFGLVPSPAMDPKQITNYVYEEIARVARENRAKLVIVILGNDYQPVEIPEGAFPADSIMVNAHQALLEHLPVINQETYEKSYFHWRGSPLRIVDTHPNENAHRIIAEAIINKIQNETQGHWTARNTFELAAALQIQVSSRSRSLW